MAGLRTVDVLECKALPWTSFLGGLGANLERRVAQLGEFLHANASCGRAPGPMKSAEICAANEHGLLQEIGSLTGFAWRSPLGDGEPVGLLALSWATRRPEP